MKLTHILFTILAVSGLTATLAADPEDRQAGESTLQASAPDESGGAAAPPQDDGTEDPDDEVVSVERQPASLGGGRGDEVGCHGGVCLLSCTCVDGCSCQGSEPCEVLQKFAGFGGCTNLVCDSSYQSCTCELTTADTKSGIETESGG